jgi:hypothetical protein
MRWSAVPSRGYDFGREAAFERADVGALGNLEAAGVDRGMVLLHIAAAHAGELVTETATIRSAELSAARVGTLVPRGGS